MLFDVVVLAGGRSSRLGGAPKAQLMAGGRSLLARTIDAAASAAAAAAAAAAADADVANDCGQVVVVGDVPADALPAFVNQVREDPVFGGPAAGIAAGVAALSRIPAQGTSTEESRPIVVLACDVPRVAEVMAAVIDAAAQEGFGEVDGFVAIDDTGRRQNLLAVYSGASLRQRVAAHRTVGDLDALSVRALLAGLDLREVVVPAGTTDDVDTWADALRLGVSAAERSATEAEAGRRPS